MKNTFPLSALALLAGLLLCQPSRAQGQVHVQFKLRDSATSTPVTATVNLDVAVYDAEQGGWIQWPSNGWPHHQTVTPDLSGVVSLVLGTAQDPLGPLIF